MVDSIHLRFVKLVAENPEAPALVWKSRVFRRRELKSALLNLVKEICKSQNKTVGYWGENHPLALLLPLACSAAGKTYFPFSPLYNFSTVSALCKEYDTLLVCPNHAARWDKTFLDWTTSASNEVLEFPAHSPAALIAFQTSGTTDKPKRVLLPESHVLSNIDEAIRAQSLRETDRILLVLSLCHSGGLCIQALPGLLAGACMTMHPSFQVSEFMAAFQPNKVEPFYLACPTTTLLVPTYLRRLLKSEDAEISALSRTHFIGIGSAPVTADVLAPFIANGTKFLNIYGLTEAGPVLATQLIDSSNLDLDQDPPIGKPGTDIEWKIDSHTAEFSVRGPSVSASYEENHVVTPSTTAEGWFNTRDLVSHENGVLRFLGRLSATFNIGGMKVHGERVENAFERLPGVAACVVNSRQHQGFGEILVALVERDPTSDLKSRRDLLKRLRETETGLAEHEIPREIEFVDSIPRSSIGKKIRSRLN